MSDSGTPAPKVDHVLEARQEAELLRETLIAGLAAAASDLSSVARDILHSATLTRIQRTGIGLVLLLMVVLLGLNGWGTWENHKSNSRVEECTTPGGQCFEDNARRTAEVVAIINRVTIAAAACAHRASVNTEEEIQSCIQAELARQETANPTGEND